MIARSEKAELMIFPGSQVLEVLVVSAVWIAAAPFSHALSLERSHLPQPVFQEMTPAVSGQVGRSNSRFTNEIGV